MIIMETNAYNQKLNRYVLNDQIVYTGFSSFNDAEECAHKKGGKLVEVVFRDGNDNPEITDEAGLIEKKMHYHVYAGDEYKFIHSSDPGFRKYADELQKIKARQQQSPPDERYFANFEIENAEDPIIVIKNDHFESVTSRERSKYLKHACVYELGVSLPKS
ncbi:conserved protein of unknown function [Chryseobacterium sp. JV274]|nr:conserved protein of unknown function [Chryseobacterium sp. JV274]